MGKRKINLGGQEVMAEEVEFETEQENWNRYILHDGSALKVKVVLAEVLRVEGHYNPNGDPVYSVNATIAVSSTSPDNLKKKG